MTTAVLTITGVREIPLENLHASLTNPRRTMNDADLEELAASIREHGISVPLLVRPIDLDCMSGEPLPFEAKVGDAYEIVCGHRRSEAATIAGLTSVPCIVRPMDDATAAEIALVDNLQRVDVPPLEEADAFGQLLDRLGSIPAVAAKVGKDLAHVAKRLKLRTLGTLECDALREKLITIDHALLLARLGRSEQDEALKWCLDRNAGSKTPLDRVIADRIKVLAEGNRNHYYGRTWECESVLRLKEHIEDDSGTLLDRAPWDLDSFVLSDEGRCSECPKNTKANTPLFGDLAIGSPTCTDGGCFREKTKAFVRQSARLAADGAHEKTPLFVSWKMTSTAPRMEKDGSGPVLAQTFKYGQWLDVGPKSTKCGHTRPAVTVDWSDAADRGYMGVEKKLRKPGEILEVCVEPKCKTHLKEYAKPKSSSTNAQRVDPVEEKKRRELQDYLEKEEAKIRRRIWDAILGNLSADDAIHIVADDVGTAPAFRKELLAKFPDISHELLEALVVFTEIFENHCDPNGYWMMQPDGVAKDRKQLWALAKRAGVDADALVVQYFAKEGIAPAADPLYPKGAKAEKAWKELRAQKAEPKPAKKPAPKKPILSAAAKKRIAAAQRKRWAEQAKKKGGRA